MASTLANELIGMLLREIEGRENESTFLLVSNSRLNKCIDFSSERFDSWSWATKSNKGTSSTNSDWDIIFSSVCLLIFDELFELIVDAK